VRRRGQAARDEQPGRALALLAEMGCALMECTSVAR
jgi:hypothetical protein